MSEQPNPEPRCALDDCPRPAAFYVRLTWMAPDGVRTVNRDLCTRCRRDKEKEMSMRGEVVILDRY